MGSKKGRGLARIKRGQVRKGHEAFFVHQTRAIQREKEAKKMSNPPSWRRTSNTRKESGVQSFSPAVRVIAVGDHASWQLLKS